MIIQFKNTIAQTSVAAGLVKDNNAVDQSYSLAVQKRNAVLLKALPRTERAKDDTRVIVMSGEAIRGWCGVA